MTKSTQIKSANYGDIFDEKSNYSSNILGAAVIIVLFSLLSGLLGFYIGDRRKEAEQQATQNAQTYTAQELASKLKEDEYNFELYKQIVANLKDKYVDPTKVTDKELFEGSLKGLVDSIGDKATNYFSAEAYTEYLESFSGKFEGIGVRLDYKNNQVAVVEVIEGSPAEKAEVKTGYVFYKVDGKDVSSSTVEDIVSRVKGDSGTKVKIIFIDPDSNKEVEKEITRAPIEVPSMRLIEKDKDTVIFEISRFTEDTVQEWKSKWDTSVDQINAKGYKNVILDLRSNGGGYLEAALYAANDFLQPNKLVLTERTKDKEIPNYTNRPNPRLKDKKVVILINGGTASASEILAGSIRHHNGYKILGSKSYGKGTVQNTFKLPDGGALKITTEYWLLPDGKKLDTENPITPDKEITSDEKTIKEGIDTGVEEAVKLF